MYRGMGTRERDQSLPLLNHVAATKRSKCGGSPDISDSMTRSSFVTISISNVAQNSFKELQLSITSTSSHLGLDSASTLRHSIFPGVVSPVCRRYEDGTENIDGGSTGTYLLFHYTFNNQVASVSRKLPYAPLSASEKYLE